MKDQTSIIILVAVVVFVAVRLYQKYYKKDNQKKDYGIREKKDTGFPSSHGKDDYEPYSGK